tara:strand:- start:4 stop:234 length:231 start_codon:yes stop_codon:yes gene_type:complete
MGKERLSLWYDQEGDFLEVIWQVREGYFTETADDRVMVKIDKDGDLLGFHILGISTIKGKALELPLSPVSRIDSAS